MKKIFLLLNILCVLFFIFLLNCQQPSSSSGSSSSSSSDNGSSGPKVTSIWIGTCNSTSTGVVSDLSITIYDDNTLSGANNVVGGYSMTFNGIYTISGTDFDGNANGTIIDPVAGTDTFTIEFTGIITGTTMDGFWVVDFTSFPDEVGVFTVTEQ